LPVLLLLLLLQYSWPEFVAADLSQVSLMEALSGTSWNKTKRTVFIIEGLVSVKHIDTLGLHGRRASYIILSFLLSVCVTQDIHGRHVSS
jgi:hypothetical protein